MEKTIQRNDLAMLHFTPKLTKFKTRAALPRLDKQHKTRGANRRNTVQGLVLDFEDKKIQRSLSA